MTKQTAEINYNERILDLKFSFAVFMVKLDTRNIRIYVKRAAKAGLKNQDRTM